jgi:hypothetical protein
VQAGRGAKKATVIPIVGISQAQQAFQVLSNAVFTGLPWARVERDWPMRAMLLDRPPNAVLIFR